MNTVLLMFYFFAAIAAFSAVSLLFTRNVFYAALLLLVCLLSFAGIYVLAFAEFLAVTQILIYAGGILVVILFGIMLTVKISGKPLVVKNNHIFSGVLAGVLLLAVLTFALSQTSFTINATTPAPQDSFHRIGIGLMSTYMLPFEMAGILLLAALIGAAVIASFTKQQKTQ